MWHLSELAGLSFQVDRPPNIDAGAKMIANNYVQWLPPDVGQRYYSKNCHNKRRLAIKLSANKSNGPVPTVILKRC